MRRWRYFERTLFRCATSGKTSCAPRTERLGGNKKETNRIPVLLLMMIVMRKVISFLLRIPPHQSRNPGWRGLRGTRAPRRASPEGGHPPEEGIPPRYPHATPELPGVSSVRAAALTGETPRQGGEITRAWRTNHSRLQLTMVLVAEPGGGGQQRTQSREARLATPRVVHIVWHRGKNTTWRISTAAFRCHRLVGAHAPPTPRCGGGGADGSIRRGGWHCDVGC
jgi:hypothetical protein